MSKALTKRLRDAARKLRTSSMPLSDFIPLLQQAADALESRAVSKTLPPLPKPDTHCFDADTGKDVWSHSPEQMQAYALAAIEAQGVPDGWYVTQATASTVKHWPVTEEQAISLAAAPLAQQVSVAFCTFPKCQTTGMRCAEECARAVEAAHGIKA